MSTTQAASQAQPEPLHYEISLQGHLSARWVDWFDGLSVTHASDGTTVLAGPVADQAALHGLLRRVRDLGLPLIAVNPVGPTQANGPEVDANTDHTHST
jgi:hypothetical protein